MHREFKVKRDLLIRNTNLSFNLQLLEHAAWTADDIAAHGMRLADVAARFYPWASASDAVDMHEYDAYKGS